MSPGPCAKRLEIPRKVRGRLRVLVRRHRAPFVVIQRARIVLAAAKGRGTAAIAREVGCTGRTVRKWKARFADDPRVEALEDARRTGRPSKTSLALRCELVQLACERPDGITAPFREVWTYASLAEAFRIRTGHKLSVSEVGRILRFESIRPHRVRQWLKSRDPHFTEKAERICELYLNPPKDAVLLCIDEKPMQTLERKNPTVVGPDGSVRREFEYKRHGTQVLLAAFNVKTGRVFGRVVPRRTAKATVSFMKAVARHYRGREIYVVWDNLNTHYDGPDLRWTKFNEQQRGRFHFVYTPKHASWMNQVEIWFSILHRRVLQYGDFDETARQKRVVEAFIRFWNRNERHPFRWTWRVDTSKTGKDRAA